MSKSFRPLVVPIRDNNIVQFLSLCDNKNLKCVSRNTKSYIYYHNRVIQVMASNIIKKFFKQSHSLFTLNENCNLNIYEVDNNHLSTNRLKLIFTILLFMKTYTIPYANSWIKSSSKFKKDIIEQYLEVNKDEQYSKYDLFKLMYKMNNDEIICIGY